MALTITQISDGQRMLNALGFNAGTVDGKLGPMTKAGTLAFQQDNSVYPMDGVMGPITLSAIKKAYDAKVIPTTTTAQAKPINIGVTVPKTASPVVDKITDTLKLTGMSKSNKIGIIIGVLAIAGYAYYEFQIKGKKKRRL